MSTAIHPDVTVELVTDSSIFNGGTTRDSHSFFLTSDSQPADISPHIKYHSKSDFSSFQFVTSGTLPVDSQHMVPEAIYVDTSLIYLTTTTQLSVHERLTSQCCVNDRTGNTSSNVTEVLSTRFDQAHITGIGVAIALTLLVVVVLAAVYFIRCFNMRHK